MEPIKLPTLPNSPVSAGDKELEGDFQLKSFGSFGFVQNVRFNPNLIIYDENYQNEVSHSKYFKNHLYAVYSIIKSHFPNSRKLVEVGCGKGAFLNIVKTEKHFEYEGYDNAYEGDDALIFIEVPQFDWIKVNQVLFDLSYEHVNYFTTKSLCSLFSKVDDCGDFFGGQYQYCLAKLSALSEKEWIDFETTSKWTDLDVEDFYEKFKLTVNFLNNKKRIWVWGGATKGVLFLMHLSNLYPSIFEKVVGVVDINPKKQSLFTPSTKIRIISDKQMFKESEDGDVVLVMNPNYYEEIKDSIAIGLSHTVEIYNV